MNDRGNYWALTDLGDRYLVALRARRKDGTTVMSLHNDQDEEPEDEVSTPNI